MLWWFNLHIPIRDVLQMTFANQAGVIPCSGQKLDKGHVLSSQRNAKRARTVAGRHTASHQTRAIGHAYGRGHVEAIMVHTLRRHCVDVGRLQNWMTIAA